MIARAIPPGVTIGGHRSLLVALNGPLLVQHAARLLPVLAASAVCPCASSRTQPPAEVHEAEGTDAPTAERKKLTGNWWGARDSLQAKGVSFELAAVYLFQNVAAGGIGGTRFASRSDESDSGNTLLGSLDLGLDTAKAEMWPGGSLDVQLQGRTGRSAVQRAGTVSPVNNTATMPNVVDRFDESAFAVTQVCYTQNICDWLGVYGGLLNTSEGDENDIAGSGVSNSHFFNSALLYSLVGNATCPNVSLGGGLLFEPSDRLSGSLSATTSSELAGEDPFENADGLTLCTEWTRTHTLFDLPGAQTAGFLYGMNIDRTDISKSPRVIISGALEGEPVPTTSSDTWAIYYNASQFISGDAEKGWGLFGRLGISDGDPNPIRWNLAGGIGGVGTFAGRDSDRWGAGVYYLGMSDAALLAGLSIGDEVGFEAFYSIALAPWWRISLDGQAVDSAIPTVDTAVVVGVRVEVDF